MLLTATGMHSIYFGHSLSVYGNDNGLNERISWEPDVYFCEKHKDATQSYGRFGNNSRISANFCFVFDWYEVSTDLVTFLISLLNKPINSQNVLLQTQSEFGNIKK